jgi:hypothetical protein
MTIRFNPMYVFVILSPKCYEILSEIAGFFFSNFGPLGHSRDPPLCVEIGFYGDIP